MSDLSKYERFDMQRINRREIVGADYNPRTISPYARRALQKYIGKRGLLGPVTVNKRTMVLVGGHQRLDCLDALEGKQDYDLNVAMVDLTPEQEREANVAMNSPAMQGEFDIDKLGELFRGGVSYEVVGFAKIDIEGMGLGTLFDAPPVVTEAVTQLAEIRTDAQPKPTPAETAIARRAEMREEHKTNRAADAETYVILIGQTREACEAFCTGIGADPQGKYVDLRLAADKCGVTLP